MEDASDAVNEYLTARYGIGLEHVLADATIGKMDVGLAGVVAITCEQTGMFSEDDGGLVEAYQGSLSVGGLTYEFRCSTFTDPGGLRFIDDIPEFTPVQWQTRIGLPRSA